MTHDWLAAQDDDVVGRRGRALGCNRKLSTQPGCMLPVPRLASLCPLTSRCLYRGLRSTSVNSHIYPRSSLRAQQQRRMSTQTIAVLDYSELKDGEMCVICAVDCKVTSLKPL